MNVQKFNMILEALRCGSMTKAAEELGYTQSGLTYAVNSLETELGLPVVIRDTNGIRLSAEGRELLDDMEALVAAERRLTGHAREILRRQGDTLNLASYPSLSSSLLPRILADFRRRNPEIRVNVRIGSRDELIDWLADGSVDYGFGGQIRLPGCGWMHLAEDAEVAILPKDFPVGGRAAFPIDEFREHSFVLPIYWAEEAGLIGQLERRGIEPDIVIESPYNEPVIALVAQGIALSAIPLLTLPPQQPGVRYLPLDPACSRSLGVNYRLQNDSDTAAGKFLKCLRSFRRRKECRPEGEQKN